MRIRAAIAMVTLAGLASSAHAQELIRVTYSWLEVVGGTTVPVSAPNSILEPGEGARISLTVAALINGQNAVGQTISYTPPPPPGLATVRGIASFMYSLSGDFGAPSAAGTWTARSISSIFAAGSFAGNVFNNGATIDAFGGGQFIAPGGTANSTNPVNNAFQGVWTPVSFTQRSVSFRAYAPTGGAPSGQQAGILAAYGITQPDPSNPATWYDNLLTKYLGNDFGAGLNIPIAPSPSTAALFAVSICAVCRRRRTRVGEACL